MKTIFKNILFLFISLTFFISCQEEVIETNQEDSQVEAFIASSNLANLMQRTSTLDGSADNIIDGANCLSVHLPVTVFANGLEIIIDSEEDFEVLEAIFDQLNNDQDTLDILFPITIILSDYSEVVIQNQLELEEYISECFDDDDDIECVDFVYPIIYSVFNTQSNDLSTVIINSDEEMYLFIENLGPSDLISLQFPLHLVLFNGETIEVQNNTELENALENAIDLCDEDDDDDYGDDDFTEDYLNELLVHCPWNVLDLERDSQDLSTYYNGYKVIFLENGELLVLSTGYETFTGTWLVVVTNDGIGVEIVVNDLNDFSLYWFAEDLGNDKIRFYQESGNSMILKKKCEENNQALLGCYFMYIESQECDDDNDGIATFILETSGEQSQDCWDLYPMSMTTHPTHQDAVYGTNAMYNPLTTPLQLESQTIYVRIYSEVSEEYAVQELEINVEECSSDCTEEIVDSYLMECHWNIVTINGSNDLITYDFMFYDAQELSITNTATNNTIYASWSTSQSTDGVILEFSNIDYSAPNASLDVIVGNWLITECEDERFVMYNEYTDEMVLERDCGYTNDDLNGIIVGGNWLVANYNNSGSDETSNYNEHQLTFNNDGIVVVFIDASNSFTGTWLTTVVDDLLKLTLDFGSQVPYDEFNNEWDVYDLDTNRIELKTITGSGNIDDVLVLERI